MKRKIQMINKKKTGSYYTSDVIASIMSNMAINNKNETILEPSFGDGVFLDSSYKRLIKLGSKKPNIYGVELQQNVYNAYKMKHQYFKGKCIDYMDYFPKNKFDVVIGNPPYVSLNKISDSAYKRKIISFMKTYNFILQSSSSMWVPFIIHSTELLKQNGKICFVLPFELTYVRYAYPLWEYLSENFGSITINRVYEDFFPNVDVETIVVLLEDKGSKTKYFKYKLFKNIKNLSESKPYRISQIKIEDIFNNKKPCVLNVLSKKQISIIQKLENTNIVEPLINECKFNIGYVSGHKDYFHPNDDVIKEYKIPKNELKSTILNAKSINGATGIGIDAKKNSIDTKLFLPHNKNSKNNKYINYGIKRDIHKGYKCSVREPWYITPNVYIPDLILTVFGDTPKLIMNSGKYCVSNSLLSGKIKKGYSPKELICKWYNSITLLYIELNVHSLGGGSLVCIPGETDMLKVLRKIPKEKIDKTAKQLNDYIIEHGVKSVYSYGDEIVLKKIYKMSEEDIILLEKSLIELKNWRDVEKRKNNI